MIKAQYYKQSRWWNPIIKTDWQWLIRLAWGTRRAYLDGKP